MGANISPINNNNIYGGWTIRAAKIDTESLELSKATCCETHHVLVGAEK